MPHRVVTETSTFSQLSVRRHVPRIAGSWIPRQHDESDEGGGRDGGKRTAVNVRLAGGRRVRPADTPATPLWEARQREEVVRHEGNGG